MVLRGTSNIVLRKDGLLLLVQKGLMKSKVKSDVNKIIGVNDEKGRGYVKVFYIKPIYI